MNKDSKIYLAGHRGMVGAAILRKLKAKGFVNIVMKTHAELDLCEQQAVRDFMHEETPDYVVLAAAKVGGIHANETYPADFIRDNLSIELNVIDTAYRAGVKQLLFLGSSCIYPRMAEQPMRENALLSGYLEQTNEPYAIAKIAGIKLCESYNRQYGTHYRSVMPTNLYGPEDNFDLNNSHVIPAIIRKMHDAKYNGDDQYTVWGSGKPKREFLHVDDMASACLHIMQLEDGVYKENTLPMLSHINIGTGKDISIGELANIVKHVVAYEGEIGFDTSKADGPPRKLMDVSRVKSLGWKPEIDLEAGLVETYKWFLERDGDFREK